MGSSAPCEKRSGRFGLDGSAGLATGRLFEEIFLGKIWQRLSTEARSLPARSRWPLNSFPAWERISSDHWKWQKTSVLLNSFGIGQALRGF